jgi:hypothetical protein
MKKLILSTTFLLIFTSFSDGWGQKAFKAPSRKDPKKAPATITQKPRPVAQPTQPVQAAPVTASPTYSSKSRRRQKTYSSYSGGNGFSRGDKLLNIGVGLSSYYYGTPVGLSFESGVSDDISVGAQFDYNSGNYDGYYSSSYRWGYSAYYAGLRGSYHVNKLFRINEDKVDLYAGVGIGYQRFRWDDDTYGYGYGYSYNYRSGLFLNYFIGGKYYFTPKIGAFVELGYTGLSSSRVGLSVKF